MSCPLFGGLLLDYFPQPAHTHDNSAEMLVYLSDAQWYGEYAQAYFSIAAYHPLAMRQRILCCI